MSRDWSGQWPQKSWNWTDDTWDNTTDNWTVKEVQAPAVRIPPEWKTTQTMFDEETLYGHKGFKTIQPTAWSRRKGFVGLNPLTTPIGLLTRHGASEYGLRLLSEGRFMGLVTTRSIAESVFDSQILKQTPEQREPKIFLMLDESIYKKYIQYCTVKLDIYNIPINLIYIYMLAPPRAHLLR